EVMPEAEEPAVTPEFQAPEPLADTVLNVSEAPTEEPESQAEGSEPEADEPIVEAFEPELAEEEPVTETEASSVDEAEHAPEEPQPEPDVLIPETSEPEVMPELIPDEPVLELDAPREVAGPEAEAMPEASAKTAEEKLLEDLAAAMTEPPSAFMANFMSRPKARKENERPVASEPPDELPAQQPLLVADPPVEPDTASASQVQTEAEPAADITRDPMQEAGGFIDVAAQPPVEENAEIEEPPEETLVPTAADPLDLTIGGEPREPQPLEAPLSEEPAEEVKVQNEAPEPGASDAESELTLDIPVPEMAGALSIDEETSQRRELEPLSDAEAEFPTGEEAEPELEPAAETNSSEALLGAWAGEASFVAAGGGAEELDDHEESEKDEGAAEEAFSDLPSEGVSGQEEPSSLFESESPQEEETDMNLKEKLFFRKNPEAESEQSAEAAQAPKQKGGGSILLMLLIVLLLAATVMNWWELHQLKSAISTAAEDAASKAGSAGPETNEEKNYEYVIDFLLDQNIAAGMERRGREGWQIAGSRRTQDSATGQYGYEFIFMRPLPAVKIGR
ncbi:MAG: hypothetical protein IJ702_06275, partial [Fretibacterium sp.]|nr:hypothetical protein [Fretibacterium sp.]